MNSAMDLINEFLESSPGSANLEWDEVKPKMQKDIKYACLQWFYTVFDKSTQLEKDYVVEVFKVSWETKYDTESD